MPDYQCPACSRPINQTDAYCPSCGTRLTLAVPVGSSPVTQPPAASPAGIPMRNLGMLPSTRYKLFGLWVALIVIAEIYVFSVNSSGADVFWGFMVFIGISIPYLVIVSIWNGVRQAQVNLEYERWLKNQRR